MSCLACFWYHTDPRAAIACYRTLHDRHDDGNRGARTGIAPSPIGLTSSPSTSPTSDTVFRRGHAGRSPAAVQRKKARERDRAYRERRKGRGSPTVPTS